MLNILMLLAGLVLTIWMVGNALGFLMMLLVAGLVGFAADALVPGKVAHGWLGAIGAGLIGSWLGTFLIGQVGPSLMGVALMPALIGAFLLVSTVALWQRAA